VERDWVLQMKNICKQYGQNSVLKNVNLGVREGEIHAVIGENGAGKSTLMNILFGMPVIHETGGFSGEVYLRGKPLQVKSPKEAMDAGIGMVHQEFMLLPGFTVTENIKLNREVTKSNMISKLVGKRLESLDYDSMNQDAAEALSKIDMSIDQWLPIAGMPVGYRQFVEIAREIDKSDVSILVCDEPTAVLTESEASQLLKTLQTIAASGIAVLFITHRLEEVMAIADTITVLRDGETVSTLNKSDAQVEQLAELMVGRKLDSLEQAGRQHAIPDDDPIMTIENLRVKMPGEEVKGADLVVRRGEILGIGGLAGHGKIGVANGIAGMAPTQGRIIVDGIEIPLNNPKASLDAGLVFLSEDRRGVGLILDNSIEDNIAIGGLLTKDKFLKHFGPLKLVDRRTLRTHAQEMISSLSIRCTGPTQRVGSLSGGNQQKVCIAKAITMEPKVLLISEPTRGIDVGAKQTILDEVLMKLNREYGITIIITSSELAELRRVCDRIAIMYQGRISAILDPQASDVDFGLAMAGRGRQVSA
jgi:simple sugar transport system ATP-binding protein